MNASHQAAALTVEIGVDLLLERGLVEVAAANSDTESDSLLFSLASDVLVDSNGRVDTTTLSEQSADGAARTLWSDEDDIDVRGHFDLGEVLEDGGEAVGEVERLQVSVFPIIGWRLVLLTFPLVSCGLMAGQVSL